MLYETIEARAIPVLKQIGSDWRDKSEKLKVQEKFDEQRNLKSFYRRISKGIITNKALSRCKVRKSYGEIHLNFESMRIDISVPDELRAEFNNITDRDSEASALCSRASVILDMTTKPGKLRQLASYLRTNVGNTAKVLKLDDSKFKAHVVRYANDITADRSCKL